MCMRLGILREREKKRLMWTLFRVGHCPSSKSAKFALSVCAVRWRDCQRALWHSRKWHGQRWLWRIKNEFYLSARTHQQKKKEKSEGMMHTGSFWLWLLQRDVIRFDENQHKNWCANKTGILTQGLTQLCPYKVSFHTFWKEKLQLISKKSNLLFFRAIFKLTNVILSLGEKF